MHVVFSPLMFGASRRCARCVDRLLELSIRVGACVFVDTMSMKLWGE